MCQSYLNPYDAADAVASSAVKAAPAAAPKPAAMGSRKRLLWELDSRAHCPVLGVCLPLAVLQRLVDKVFRGQNIDQGYELHKGAVSECNN